MEALVQRDDLPLLAAVMMAAQAGELAGGFVGFGAAVAEKRLAVERRAG